MPTAIFLSNRLMTFYRLEKIKSVGVRFILITSQKYLGSLPGAIKLLFDEVYIVPNATTDYAAMGELSFDHVKEIFSHKLLLSLPTEEMHLICNDEANVTLAGSIREIFGISGLKPVMIERYKNKLLMKELLQKAEVRVPRFLKVIKPLNIKNYFQELTKKLGLPFIIKPIDSMGSIGVSLISKEKDLRDFFSNDLSGHFSYEAEEYIEGDFFHCDTLMRKDKMSFFACSQYMRPGLNYSKGESRGSIPLPQSHPLNLRLHEFTKKVISTLGGFNGATHLEVFLTQKDELIFLEIGARTPGSFVVPVYEKTFGVNLLDEDYCIQMNFPSFPKTMPLAHAFWCRIPEQIGKIKKINPINLISAHDIKWNVKTGDVMSNATSIISSAADILVYNQNYEILREDFEYLKNHMPFELDTIS